MLLGNNSEWFKNDIAATLTGCEINYRYFETGDFGSLDQVLIESSTRSGQIDFWGQNYLGIFLFDYSQEEVLINVLLWDNQQVEKERSMNEFLNYLR